MVTVALSSLSPIALNYGLDVNLNLKGRTIYFKNGLSLYDSDIMTDYVDAIFNKDNLLVLTSDIKFHTVVDVLSDEVLDLSTYVGSTTIGISGSDLFWSLDQGVLGTRDDMLLQTQDSFFIRPSQTTGTNISATNVGDAPIYYVNFENNLITISDVFDQFLTIDLSTFAVSFSAEIIPDTDNAQHFGYILDGLNIVLMTASSALEPNQRTIFFDTTTGVLTAGPGVSVLNPITANHTFILNSFYQSGVNSISATQANWVVYDRLDESVGINTQKSIYNTQHNLLVSTPFKSLTDSVLDVNINNLKNYQTPEYEYLLENGIPYGREYNKIITGVNQDNGYDNIYLSFNSHTQKVTFEKDKYTYFHYPPTAPIVSLSASSLVTTGAFAGSVPWRSDKVFKKQANYAKYSNWGNSTVQDGVWFCAWLKENTDTEIPPQWMDRYFNPSYITTPTPAIYAQLLSALPSDLVEDISNPIMWDVPSTMTFDPGVLYIYHHIGETRNDAVVESLPFEIMSFTQWDSTILIDQVGTYNGNIFGFNLNPNQATLENITNKCYAVSGTYGYVEKIDNIFDNDELSISFIMNVKDWEHIIGDQIFGNYYGGGIGVFNNNPILTPYFTLYDTNVGSIFTSNTDFRILNKNNFIPYLQGRPTQIIKTRHDEEYYVLDSNQNILFYDIENVLQTSILLTTLVSGINVSQFQIDGEYNFHLLDRSADMYYKISSTGILLSSASIAADTFTIDYDNTPRFPSTIGASAATVNSQSDLYYITSNYLYRDDIVIWTANSFENILCDDYDNIWLLYNSNSIAKLDKNNKLLFSTILPISSTDVGPRSLNFFKELTPTGLVESIMVFDSRTQYAHKLSTSCDVLSSINTADFTGSAITLQVYHLFGVNDNGFDWQRKYVKPTMIVPGISVKTFLRQPYINGATNRVVLQTSTLGLHDTKTLTVTFNFANGTLKFYINGDLVASENFEGFNYKISANKNTLSWVLGTNASKRDVLINDLYQPGYYTLDGTLGDFHIYSKELSQSNVRALTDYSRDVAYKDLVWNMPIGSRNYVEEVERFFKHKMPGNKSQFFNIKLTGLNIVDTIVRTEIEESIRGVLRRINPVHATLYNIIWE